MPNPPLAGRFLPQRVFLSGEIEAHLYKWSIGPDCQSYDLLTHLFI